MGVSESGNVPNELFIHLFDFKLTLNLHGRFGGLDPRVDHLYKLISIIFIEGVGQSIVGFVEDENGVEDDMKLLWPTNLFPAAGV